jgi:hypothetical protein
MTAHTKLSEAEAALRRSKGMVAVAARELGVSRQALYRRINETPALAELLVEERELVTDTAELALHKAIVSGEAWAVCFYLKTMGKQRGFVERQELTGASGGPLEITEIRVSPPPGVGGPDGA